MAPRVIKAYDCYIEADLPVNGIIAGCTQSTFWARLFLYGIIQAAVNRVPRPTPVGPGAAQIAGQVIRTFIDDISQKVYARTFAEVSKAIIPAAEGLAQDLVGNGCVIREKSVLLPRHKATRKHILVSLARRGVHITAATMAKDLGVGTTGGSRRCVAFIKARIIKAGGRVRRTKMLQKVNKRHVGCTICLLYTSEAADE